MKEIWQNLMEGFGPQTIARFLRDILPDIATALIIFTVFLTLWMILERALKTVFHRVRLDPTLASFIRAMTKTIILTIGLLTAVKELGFDITSILASLGVAGLTVGFAARDALSNIISGLFIFWDRPFVLGDLIELDEFYGRVEDITLRSTRIVTPDGKMLAIPNTKVINSTVSSYTNFPFLRLEIDISVGVGEDFARLRRIFQQVIAGDDRYLQQPAPEMVIEILGNFNVTVRFLVWIGDEKMHIPMRYELREKLFEGLRSAGVEMPFETFSLTPLEVVAEKAS
ncbi:MAG: mechanosensitive ion channel family protein [Syntrophotaleaceae bacterium]